MHAEEAKKMTEKYLYSGVALSNEIEKAFNMIEYFAKKGLYKGTVSTPSVFTKEVLGVLKRKGYKVRRSLIVWSYLEVSWKHPK